MPSVNIFNKRLLRESFERAAPYYEQAAHLQREVAGRLLERLDMIRIQPRRIADLGAGTGFCVRDLVSRYGESEVIALDIAPAMLRVAKERGGAPARKDSYVCGDVEAMPLADSCVDLIVTNLTLQWCTDLTKTFPEFQRILRPGGLLLFSTFGPDTLWELRDSWARVDQDIHVNLFSDMHDVGDCLMSCGYRDVVMDVDRMRETFPDMYALMRSLKRIGAHNVNSGRPLALTGKRRLAVLADAYDRHRSGGLLPASYEVIYGHAWAPETPGMAAVAVY